MFAGERNFLKCLSYAKVSLYEKIHYYLCNGLQEDDFYLAKENFLATSNEILL